MSDGKPVPTFPAIALVMGLLTDRVAAGDHRADVVPDARDQDHDDVNDDEEDDGGRGDEVQRARRLAAGEEIDEPREGSIDAGRHAETGQHDQRQDDEDQDQVGELLQDVVVAAVVEAEAEMLHDRGADAAKLRPARDEIAPDMAVEEARNDIDEAVDDEEPGEEEVPGGARGLIL